MIFIIDLLLLNDDYNYNITFNILPENFDIAMDNIIMNVNNESDIYKFSLNSNHLNHSQIIIMMDILNKYYYFKKQINIVNDANNHILIKIVLMDNIKYIELIFKILYDDLLILIQSNYFHLIHLEQMCINQTLFDIIRSLNQLQTLNLFDCTYDIIDDNNNNNNNNNNNKIIVRNIGLFELTPSISNLIYFDSVSCLFLDSIVHRQLSFLNVNKLIINIYTKYDLMNIIDKVILTKIESLSVNLMIPNIIDDNVLYKISYLISSNHHLTELFIDNLFDNNNIILKTLSLNTNIHIINFKINLTINRFNINLFEMLLKSNINLIDSYVNITLNNDEKDKLLKKYANHKIFTYSNLSTNHIEIYNKTLVERLSYEYFNHIENCIYNNISIPEGYYM